MPYSTKYNNSVYSTEENIIFNNFIKTSSIEKDDLLFDDCNIYAIKINRNKCSILGINGNNVRFYNKTYKPFKFLIGNGSPNKMYRGLNGFLYEKIICDEFNKLLKSTNHVNKSLHIEFNKLFTTNPHNIQLFSKNLNKNNKRPVCIKDTNIYLKNNTARTIADIVILSHDTHNSAGVLFIADDYVSCKSTKLVTFANIGIRNIFPEKYIQGNINPSEIGMNIIEMLGIDYSMFCKIFNNFKKTKIENNIIYLSTNINKLLYNNLLKFIELCKGTGNYIITHAMDSRHIMYRISDIKDTLIESCEYQYGGKDGKSKRLNIIIITDKMKYTINFRNKNSGIYPTHFMCDFVYKN
tara:strand:- start:1843 stop:2901 length:1059 start_codon:yes stop_codon:yes gene_type:complete